MPPWCEGTSGLVFVDADDRVHHDVVLRLCVDVRALVDGLRVGHRVAVVRHDRVVVDQTRDVGGRVVGGPYALAGDEIDDGSHTGDRLTSHRTRTSSWPPSPHRARSVPAAGWRRRRAARCPPRWTPRTARCPW